MKKEKVAITNMILVAEKEKLIRLANKQGISQTAVIRQLIRQAK